MKPLNIIFVSLCIIIILLCIINILYNVKEGFLSPSFDPNAIQENCLDYITYKNWEIDYGMSYKNTEIDQLTKQKHIKDRLEIISGLTTLKVSKYSVLGQQYLYGDACVLQKENLKLYNTDNNSCNIENKVLSDNNINEFGRKNINNENINLYTPDAFSKITSFDSSKMNPNDGCFVDTRNKDNFFKMIDNLISTKKFERDNQINLYEVDKNKALKDLSSEKEINKIGTDKINELNSYLDKITLIDSCRNITTSLTPNNDGDLKALDQHDVSCNPDEVLQQVKFNSTTIPFKQIRYHSTKNNAFLISTKDVNAIKFVEFLKTNPTAKFKITNLSLVSSTEANICSDWGCTCQGFSDKFKTYPGQWQNAPVDPWGQHPPEQSFWENNRCTTHPKKDGSSCDLWGCTCQGFSDTYGTRAWVGWGYAVWNSIGQQWWNDNKCLTAPDYDGNMCKPWGCTCQGMTDKYKTINGVTWGLAPGVAKWWWIGHGCRTGTISNLIYDSTQIYAFTSVEQFNNDFMWINYSGGQLLLPEQCFADIDVIIGDGKKIFYTARCCNINTNIGDNARFVQVSTKESTKIKPTPLANKWNAISLFNDNNNVITGPVQCDDKLANQFKFTSYPNDNNFNYKFTCSDIQNDIVKSKPNKNITWDCSTNYTDQNNMTSGRTMSMQDMDVQCREGSYISDIKMKKNGKAYRMEYKCCKPIIGH
jgi:hypothetical protein